MLVVCFSYLETAYGETTPVNTTANTTTSLVVTDDKPYKLVDQSQFCWNIELDDDTLFCYGMVDYPITEELYYNASYYDALAKADYKVLL